VLLGCFGIGAASGAVVRPRLDDRFNHDELVFGSSVMMAGSLVVEGLTHMPWAAGVAMFVGGLAWATALTSTSVSSFSALPEWVRARGMGLYQLVLAGGVALGSAAWGLLAEKTLTGAHLVAAGMLVVGLTTSRRWLLGNVSGLDLRLIPTDDPTITIVPHPTDGPVLVTLVYEVPADDVRTFAEAMRQVERHRRRTGAYRWGLFRDLAIPDQFIETFVVESWGEHLRQHRRTTVNADDRFLDPVRRYLAPGATAGHYLSVYSPDGLTQTDHIEPDSFGEP
jgi:MFS family permease